jgi:hypothetical protein
MEEGMPLRHQLETSWRRGRGRLGVLTRAFSDRVQPERAGGS